MAVVSCNESPFRLAKDIQGAPTDDVVTINFADEKGHDDIWKQSSYSF